jgi:exonuclease SbcD
VLCAGATADEVNLLVGHLMVHGASPSGDEREAHTVMDYSVSAHAFPAGLSYVALGHLHRHQRVPAPAPVYYAGSPLQLDFGEVEQAKGVVVVEASPGLPARVQFRPLRSGRRLRVLRGSLAEVEALAADVADDDYVKVVLDEATRPGLADAARRLVPQAVDVIIDPARRPQQAPRRVRAGRSHRELFVEYLRERDAFDERVVALFDELAEEAHEA